MNTKVWALVAVLGCLSCGDVAQPSGGLVGGGGASGAEGGGAPQGGGGAASSTLLLALTLHLENATFDAAYFQAIDAFTESFEAHGGRLTFEPRSQVVTASLGPPQLLDWRELEARGHSIGSHAAIGGTEVMALEDFTSAAQQRFDQLAPLVERIDHVSGNCGSVDWVTGVVSAGFSATTATTVLCMYSIAPADRPAGYQDLDCNGATDPTCHASYPSDPSQRLHPWRAASSAAWLSDDADGELVIVPGAGTLPCLEEESEPTGAVLADCTFDQADVDIALADLDEAISLRDPARLNSFYWVWGSWSLSRDEEPVLESFLAGVDERVTRGDVQWATISQILDAYAAWEADHR